MIDTEKLLETVNLPAVIEADLGPGLHGRWHCPWCQADGGNSLPFSVNGKFWHCFGCNKSGDAIGWMTGYHRLQFTEACQRLGGGNDYQTAARPAPKPRQLTPPALPSDEKQKLWWSWVWDFHECLISPAGQPGQDYLNGRGLHVGTWSAYSLGYTVYNGRQAISIPWMGDDMITGIKYRFLDDAKPKYKYTTGSKCILFGLQNVFPAPVLVLVEGEINCMSICQAASLEKGALGLTAASFGAQIPSASEKPVLKALAAKFERVFVWTDEISKSKAIVTALDRPARALLSPKRGDEKFDANAMLQAGLLPDFLRAMLAA